MGSKEIKSKISEALGKVISSSVDILGETVTDIIQDNREELKNTIQEKINEALKEGKNKKVSKEPIKQWSPRCPK